MPPHPRRLPALALAALPLLLAHPPAAGAEPVTAARLRPAPGEPGTFLVDGAFLRGEARLARMRRRGELPDLIPAGGRCRYALAGDPGVAYYVKDCG